MLDGSNARISVKVFDLPKNEAQRLATVTKVKNEHAKRISLGKKHPHLAESLGISEDSSKEQIHLATAWAPGLSAQHWLEGGWNASSPTPSSNSSTSSSSSDAHQAHGRLFTASETTTLAYILCSALSHMHDPHCMYHCDVRPSNILFFDATSHTKLDVQSARLANFGSAKVAHDTGHTVTETASIPFAAAGYHAPERLIGRRASGSIGAKDEAALIYAVDDKADVWSFGATLLAMLTGHVLGNDEALFSTLEKSLENGDIDWKSAEYFNTEVPSQGSRLDPRAHAAWRAAPQELRDLIVSCLALRPENRPSMQQLLPNPMPLLLQEAAKAKALEATHAAAASDKKDQELAELKAIIEAQNHEIAELKMNGGTASTKLVADLASRELACQQMCASLGDIALSTAGLPSVAIFNQVCVALSAIATSAAAKDFSILSFIVDPIATCLRDHASNATVCATACRAFINIASIPAGQDACIKAGAVQLITSCLKNHAAAADMCERASWALSNIADSQAGKAACLSAGAVPLITASLKKHATSPEACAQGCRAFINIAFIPEGQDACIASGAAAAIAACLTNHAESATVCDAAIRAFINIGWVNVSHRSEIIATGCIPYIVAAHEKHAGKTREGAKILLNLLGYSESGAKL